MAKPRASAAHDDVSEQPFPLKRLFRTRIVPAFLAFFGLLLVLTGLTANWATKTIYLELAQRRAQTIARAVDTQAPDAWHHFLAGKTVNELSAPDNAALVTAFKEEVKELALADLKVYDLDRRVLFATQAEKIGSREEGLPLRRVIESNDSTVDTATNPDGTLQYELYVPFYDKAGHLRAVFELYEPVNYLNAILLRAALPALAVPGLLLLAVGIALDRLVVRAQADIDARAHALNELRHRIESFVSHSAVTAARAAQGRHGIKSKKNVVALLYSDIRDFTSFAEANPPEKVVAFLNDIMSLQVTTVEEHGGDVDKMIGDAVFARFDGRTGGKRAVAAARAILSRVEQADYPRGLGIGVFRGPVIVGAVGPQDRRDFTAIGDAVNIAARLCSAAKAGELVADAALANDDFAPVETIRVKGRRKPLTVRRWKA